MKQPWKAYLKAGIVQFMAYPQVMKGEGPVYETVKKIVDDEFFGSVEITHIADVNERKRVAQILATGHIEVGYGAQPVLLSNKLDINSLNPDERRRAMDRVKLAIDEAYEVGAGKLAVLSGKDVARPDRARATALLVASLKEMCAYAASKGTLTIVLETFDDVVDKKCLIGPSTAAAEVAAAVRAEHSNFGLMVDLSHIPMLNETSIECLAAVRDYLVHVHVGNCLFNQPGHPADGDQHPRFGIPGGKNDVPELAEFLRGLFAIGYLGDRKAFLPTVAFEVKPLPGEDSDVLVAGTKRAFEEAWALV
ncbi:MAG: sugar phosphate isomerase/epimerase [Firmicutes bacterium]|jgi:sugar phosphate isomerase/epimerase|nr:sugar phosphate isomerase/epimerase [Bacillota bacterium]